MRNLTFKRRGIATKCYKSEKIKKFCGKYSIVVRNEEPEFYHKLEHNKPKSFSFYNWYYPQIVQIIKTNWMWQETNPETLYQELKEWHSNQMTTVVVEVSCRLQHLSMCFDSPHFTSCGRIGYINEDVANLRMQNPFTFCVFTRDSRGLINNRVICKLRKNDCVVYSYYGSKPYNEPFTSLVSQLTKLPIVTGGSFL